MNGWSTGIIPIHRRRRGKRIGQKKLCPLPGLALGKSLPCQNATAKAEGIWVIPWKIGWMLRHAHARGSYAVSAMGGHSGVWEDEPMHLAYVIWRRGKA